jgi:hypothetical protein
MENKSKMGRPKKSAERRIGINCYITGGLIDKIDTYIEEKQVRGYSRSDFMNEAAEFYLRHVTEQGGHFSENSTIAVP